MCSLKLDNKPFFIRNIYIYIPWLHFWHQIIFQYFKLFIDLLDMENHPRPHILFWIPREQDIHVLPKSVNGIRIYKGMFA